MWHFLQVGQVVAILLGGRISPLSYSVIVSRVLHYYSHVISENA